MEEKCYGIIGTLEGPRNIFLFVFRFFGRVGGQHPGNSVEEKLRKAQTRVTINKHAKNAIVLTWIYP